MTAKLTVTQKKDILHALQTHGIKIKCKDSLFAEIDRYRVAWGENKLRRDTARSRKADIILEICRLRRALTNLSTATYLALTNPAENPPSISTTFKKAFHVILDACDQALQTDQIIQLYSSKRGRQKNNVDVALVNDMASLFYSLLIDRKPTNTPYGPFDDFVTAVFLTLNPKSERTSLRKIICAARKEYWYMPCWNLSCDPRAVSHK